MATKHLATIEDLYRVAGKAEIVSGEIVEMPPTGGEPGFAGDEIYASLREYARRGNIGLAVSENKGFRVNLPHRTSFSPDAAYYIGPKPGMKFFDGAPIFAVEVRSEGDYGPQAESEIAAKRADYFAAGTCSARISYGPIAPVNRTNRPSIDAARSPMPSVPCQVGGWPSMTFF